MHKKDFLHDLLLLWSVPLLQKRFYKLYNGNISLKVLLKVPVSIKFYISVYIYHSRKKSDK